MISYGSSAVTTRHKIAYAAPAFFLAVVGIPVFVYVPKFYTDVVGIDIVVLGNLLLAVRIFDAVTDPLIGFISDTTRSPMGRRRPYIAIASFFVALSVILLLNPPEGTRWFKTLWFTVSIFSVFLFWTIIIVPYEALGPEITFDYHERTALFSTRDGFLIAGTLAAASSPAMVQWAFELPGDASGERAKFFWISVIYAPLIIASCLWCVVEIKEHFVPPKQPLPFKMREDMRSVLRNRPFIILLVSYTISALGNNLPATLILYYVEYVLESAAADVFLILYFLSGIVFLPFWVAVSRRIGKKKTWLISMAVNTGVFGGVYFLGPGQEHIFAVLVLVSGIGFGAALAIPSAIQADVIDYDELLVGKRREGRYIGLWSIAKKVAAAFGIGIALMLLGKTGYVPNLAQSEPVKLTLRILYAVVPCGCNLLAFIIALMYPISSDRHDAIREAIDRRRKGYPVTDPLRPDQRIA